MDGASVVGRGTELVRIRTALARPGFSAVVLTGEPGIGKTTLWRAAVDHEVLKGKALLSCRPTQAESSLSYAGLADLVGPLMAEGAGQLPAPQAQALRVALRLEFPGARGVDQHSVAAGALGLVRAAIASGPVLIGIDDLQWLDAESAAILEYVVRRVQDLPVHVLLSGRADAGVPVTAVLRAEVEPDALLEVHVGPLDLDAVHGVLLQHTGTVPPHPDLARITELSRGNPLYALDLASRAGVPGPGARTVVAAADGDGLVQALRDRHLRLPPDVRLLLAAAAIAVRPKLDLLASAGFADVVTSIEPAELAGIAVVADDGVVFRHPLFAAVARESATSAELRLLHRRLADASTDPEDRVRHLAQASTGRRESAAAAAEEAASHARRRGAPGAAAELARLSVERTSLGDPTSLARRQLLLGDLLATAGAGQAAERVLHEASVSPDIAVRVRSLLVLARLASRSGPSPTSMAIAQTAADEARGGDLEMAALTELALLCAPTDPAQGLRHARRALELARHETQVDEATLARARFVVMDCESSLGGPLDDQLARQLPSPAADRSESRVMDRVGYRLGNVLLVFDDMARTREVLEESLAVVDAEGDEGSRATVVGQLAELEVVTGQWSRARRYAEAQLDSALRASQLKLQAAAWETLASIDLREGDASAARARLDAALAWSTQHDDLWEETYARRTLGLLLLSQGDSSGALEALSAVERTCRAFGVVAPGVLRHHGDLIEALCLVGQHEEALALAADLDQRGETCGSALTRAAAARGRALVLSHDGDLDAAADAAEAACVRGRTVEAPFELGRSLLTLGQIRRRRREKQQSRTALEEASGVFAALGAEPWSRRTADELARLGLRPETPGALTATEEAVAALAARGASNPEIAAELHISRKTVEFHLTKVFRKLDVRSRTQLAARWTAHVPTTPGGSPERED